MAAQVSKQSVDQSLYFNESSGGEEENASEQQEEEVVDLDRLKFIRDEVIKVENALREEIDRLKLRKM